MMCVCGCVCVCVCVCVKGVCVHVLSCVQLFAIPLNWSPPSSVSMEFSRKEYWGGLPFPTPGHLPDPRIEPASLVSPALTGNFFFFKPRSHLGNPSKWLNGRYFCRIFLNSEK